MFAPLEQPILVYNSPVDMRRSIDGLSTLINQELSCRPDNGTLYVFGNRVGDKIKILYWHRNGFCLWYKRLENGRFRFNWHHDQPLRLSSEQLRWLLDGLDYSKLCGHKAVHYSQYF